MKLLARFRQSMQDTVSVKLWLSISSDSQNFDLRFSFKETEEPDENNSHKKLMAEFSQGLKKCLACYAGNPTLAVLKTYDFCEKYAENKGWEFICNTPRHHLALFYMHKFINTRRIYASSGKTLPTPALQT